MHAKRYDGLDNLAVIIIVLATFLFILCDYIKIGFENRSIANPRANENLNGTGG
jgi:hypothetical protein